MSAMSESEAEEESYVQVGGEEGDGEEEREDSDDDEYNKQQFGIYQALPVPEGSGSACLNPEEATTVEEYLQAVRAQAAKCPQVVRVEHPSFAAAPSSDSGGKQASSMPSSSAASVPAGALAEASVGGSTSRQTSMAAYVSQMVAAGALPGCPDWAKPSKGWLRRFVSEFAQLRRSLQELSSRPSECPPTLPVPEPHDSDGWERLCFERLKPASGQGAPPHVQPDPGTAGAAATAVLAGSAGVAGSKAVGAGAGAEGQAATPTAMAQQEWQASGQEVSEEALLPLVLRMDQVVIGRLLARHVADLQVAQALGPLQAQWIYALGAVLEKPVHADVSASLRALMRRVASLRAGQLKGPEDPQVALLNVVAAVVGAYFGQDAELLNALGPDADLP